MKLSVLLTLTALILTNCTIYRSPQRKEFESEFPTFKAQNLSQKSCSNTSLRNQAHAARLAHIFVDSSSEDQFLWEYIIEQKSFFETDNLKGIYCVFESVMENNENN